MDEFWSLARTAQLCAIYLVWPSAIPFAAPFLRTPQGRAAGTESLKIALWGAFFRSCALLNLLFLAAFGGTLAWWVFELAILGSAWLWVWVERLADDVETERVEPIGAAA